MDNMVQFICNGVTEFTPELLVRLIVFVLVMDCISSVAYAISSIGKR